MGLLYLWQLHYLSASHCAAPVTSGSELLLLAGLALYSASNSKCHFEFWAQNYKLYFEFCSFPPEKEDVRADYCTLWLSQRASPAVFWCIVVILGAASGRVWVLDNEGKMCLEGVLGADTIAEWANNDYRSSCGTSRNGW